MSDLFSTARSSAKSAIRGVQALLEIATGRQMQIDGKVGSETRSALNNAPSHVKRAAEQLALARGHDLAELMAPKAMKSKGRGSPTAEMKATIEKWCKVFKVNYDLAMTIASVESDWDPQAYNASGKASGLFQITGAAIQDVKERRPKHFFPSTNRFDLDFNCMVGVGYISVAAGYAGVDAMSPSMSVWVDIYSTYNLGPGAYRAWKAGRYNSDVVVKSWSTQAAMLKRGGIPQYTANVRDFLSSANYA